MQDFDSTYSEGKRCIEHWGLPPYSQLRSPRLCRMQPLRIPWVAQSSAVLPEQSWVEQWAAGAALQSARSSAGLLASPLLRRANRGRAATVITRMVAISNVETERGSWLHRSIARQRLRPRSKLLRRPHGVG